jgi:hypothetical protein
VPNRISPERLAIAISAAAPQITIRIQTSERTPLAITSSFGRVTIVTIIRISAWIEPASREIGCLNIAWDQHATVSITGSDDWKDNGLTAYRDGVLSGALIKRPWAASLIKR